MESMLPTAEITHSREVECMHRTNQPALSEPDWRLQHYRVVVPLSWMDLA